MTQKIRRSPPADKRLVPLRLKLVVAGLGLLASLAVAGDTATRTRKVPQAEVPVTQAVFAEGRLWLRDDKGRLFSLAKDEADARPEIGEGEVAGLCVSGGRPTVIFRASTTATDWQIRQATDAGWQTVATFEMEHQNLDAFGCDATRIVAITDYPMAQPWYYFTVIKDGQVDSRRINGAVHPGDITTLVDGDYMYLGMDAGEWGGGLQRFDLTTGLLEAIDKLDSNDPCGGPLYYECNPVTAISAVPGRPGCVAIALGLQHMGWDHGSVLAVCGRDVSRLYQRVARVDPPGSPEGQPMTQMIPFYALSANGNGPGNELIAMGTDGVYSIDPASGAGTRRGLPGFRRYGSFTVSFALPGFVLVEGREEHGFSRLDEPANTLVVPRL